PPAAGAGAHRHAPAVGLGRRAAGGHAGGGRGTPLHRPPVPAARPRRPAAGGGGDGAVRDRRGRPGGPLVTDTPPHVADWGTPGYVRRSRAPYLMRLW